MIAGHGDGDPGAIGEFVDEVFVEADETRKLVNAVWSNLCGSAIDVIVYPTTQNAYKDWKNGALSLPAADIVLEIHFNAYKHDDGDGKTCGVECYVPTRQAETGFAELLCKTISQFGFTNRGVKRKNYSVISHANAAGADSYLLEVCFIDDWDDVTMYKKNRESISVSLSRAIIEFLETRKNEHRT